MLKSPANILEKNLADAEAHFESPASAVPALGLTAASIAVHHAERPGSAKDPISAPATISSGISSSHSLAITLPEAPKLKPDTTCINIPSSSPITQHSVRTRSYSVPHQYKTSFLVEMNRKIELLASKGYQLIGQVPDVICSSQLIMGQLLFVRHAQYFSFELKSLCNDKIKLSMGEYGIVCAGFKAIESENYIYVIIQTASLMHQEDKNVIFLKFNADISGHLHLATPYLKAQAEILFTEKNFNELQQDLLTATLALDLSVYPRYLMARDGIYCVQCKDKTILAKKLHASAESIDSIKTQLPSVDVKFQDILSKKVISRELRHQLYAVTEFAPISLAGGEIHFWQQEPLLINNKSGSIPTTANTVKALITSAFGHPMASLFDPHVERPEVIQVLQQRIAEKTLPSKLALLGLFSISGQRPLESSTDRLKSPKVYTQLPEQLEESKESNGPQQREKEHYYQGNRGEPKLLYSASSPDPCFNPDDTESCSAASKLPR